MTEPKTATERKSSTSLHCNIPSPKLTVTVQTGKKRKNRCCRCMHPPDAHTLSNGGRFLLSSTRTASIPVMISRCILTHTGTAAANNKQFLHQNLYYLILCRNQRKIFELKQGYLPFPSVLKEQLSEYFIFTRYTDSVLF